MWASLLRRPWVYRTGRMRHLWVSYVGQKREGLALHKKATTASSERGRTILCLRIVSDCGYGMRSHPKRAIAHFRGGRCPPPTCTWSLGLPDRFGVGSRALIHRSAWLKNSTKFVDEQGGKLARPTALQRSAHLLAPPTHTIFSPTVICDPPKAVRLDTLRALAALNVTYGALNC